MYKEMSGTDRLIGVESTDSMTNLVIVVLCLIGCLVGYVV